MFRRILVAYDASPGARLALRQAFDLARAEHVESVSLLGVVPPVRSAVAVAGVDPTAFTEELRQVTVRDLAAARDEAPADVSIRTQVKQGAVGEAILAAAAEGDHDLIVMGARGLGPIGSMLLGSASTHVLHHTDRAVLVAHAPRTAEQPAQDRELQTAAC